MWCSAMPTTIQAGHAASHILFLDFFFGIPLASPLRDLSGREKDKPGHSAFFIVAVMAEGEEGGDSDDAKEEAALVLQMGASQVGAHILPRASSIDGGLNRTTSSDSDKLERTWSTDSASGLQRVGSHFFI